MPHPFSLTMQSRRACFTSSVEGRNEKWRKENTVLNCSVVYRDDNGELNASQHKSKGKHKSKLKLVTKAAASPTSLRLSK
jgi:hypothetical protein